MLRACEFAARLKFRMEPDLVAAIADLKGEIRKSAPPRVTEEFLDPLRRGWGHDTYRLWSDTGLLGVLLPELDAAVASHDAPFSSLFWKMLHDLDARKAAGGAHHDAALLSVLFLPLVFAAIRARGSGGARVDPSQILLVLENVVNPLALRMSLPNLMTHLVKQTLYTLGPLTSTRPDHPAARRLVARSWFAPSLALLSLYSKASGRYLAAAAAWQEVLERAGRRDDDAPSPLPGAPVPFPEALVPPPALARALAGAAVLPMPGDSRPAGRKRRRRGGRRHAPGGAAAN